MAISAIDTATGNTPTRSVRLVTLPLFEQEPGRPTRQQSSTDVYHTIAAGTVDTPAYGLLLDLALFVRLRVQHDSIVAGAPDGAVGIGVGLHAAVDDVLSRSLRGTEPERN